jgi:hypothetical protein
MPHLLFWHFSLQEDFQFWINKKAKRQGESITTVPHVRKREESPNRTEVATPKENAVWKVKDVEKRSMD